MQWDFTAESHQALADGVKQLLKGPTPKALDEQRQLVELLLKLHQRRMLEYPVCVKHSDRPDFQVLVGKRHISIEASKITTINLEYAASMQRRGLNEVLTSTALLHAGEQLLPRKEVIRKGFNSSQFSIPPLLQDSDLAWWEQFESVASRKLAILSGSGFQRGQENWLLLWDRIGTMKWQIEHRLPRLQEWFASIWKPSNQFDRLFVQAEDFTWVTSLSNDGSEVSGVIF